MFARLILTALVVALFASPAIGAPVSGESSESGETLQVIESLEKQCLNRTGSTEAFEQLVVGFAFAPMCLAGHLDIEGLTTGIDQLDETNRVQFFDTYCPQVNESLQCITPMFELLRKCFDGEELAVMDIIFNIVPDALNLICKDHGDFFFKLDGPEVDNCVEKIDDFTIECSANISNATDAMNLSEFGEEQCLDVKQFRDCIADKFETCKAPGFVDLVDLFYKPVVKATKCAKYINLEERNAIETNQV